MIGFHVSTIQCSECKSYFSAGIGHSCKYDQLLTDANALAKEGDHIAKNYKKMMLAKGYQPSAVHRECIAFFKALATFKQKHGDK